MCSSGSAKSLLGNSSHVDTHDIYYNILSLHTIMHSILQFLVVYCVHNKKTVHACCNDKFYKNGM